jgi:hypothetical protein
VVPRSGGIDERTEVELGEYVGLDKKGKRVE